MALRSDIESLDGGHMRMAVKIATLKDELRKERARLDQLSGLLTILEIADTLRLDFREVYDAKPIDRMALIRKGLDKIIAADGDIDAVIDWAMDGNTDG